MTVTDIDDSATTVLRSPYFASIYDGELAVTRDPDSSDLRLKDSVYRLTLQPVEPAAAPARVITGTVLLEGEATSLLGRVIRFAGGVLIRESGF
jgi:hypothetical protein